MATLPKFAGNFDLPYRIRHGVCNLCVIGDSRLGGEATQQEGFLIKTWNPDAWIGYVTDGGTNGKAAWEAKVNSISATYGAKADRDFDDGLTGVYADGSARDRASTGSGLLGPTGSANGYAPKTTGIATFNGTALPTGAPGNNNQIYRVSLPYVDYATRMMVGDWWGRGTAGTIYARMLLYKGTGTPYAGTLRLQTRTGATVTTSGAVDWSAQATGLSAIDVTGNAGQPDVELRYDGGYTPANGEYLTIVATRVRNAVIGTSGLQLDFLHAMGSSKLDHFLDVDCCSDANWNQYHSLMGTTDFLLWQDNNNQNYIKADYKTRLANMITRCRAAVGGCKIWLFYGYPTNMNQTRQLEFVQAGHELATTDGGIFFSQMFEYSGSQAFVAGRYLADGVHQQTTYGFQWVASEMWGHVVSGSEHRYSIFGGVVR